jgi:DNA-binding NarL/FixJ family response regulator
MREDTMTHRVLIAEDNPLLRDALRAMISLSEDLEVIAEASDGKAAIQAALACKPDIITMDLSMPNMGGLEATRIIRKRCPEIRIVILSGLHSEHLMCEVLAAGADSYVLKESAQNGFLDALRSTMAGRMYLSPEISGHVLRRLVTGESSDDAHDPLKRLTPREHAVMKLVSEGRTNRSAAEYLNVSPKTVEKHRASLMQKLGLRSATELILMALNRGWVEPGHSPFADTAPFCQGADETRRAQTCAA